MILSHWHQNWLMSNIFVARFHFCQFQAIMSQILQQLLFKVTIYKTWYGLHFSTQSRPTRDFVERHSYLWTPFSLSMSRNILLEKTMKPLTVWKFVGTEISKPYFPATCTWHSMFTWLTSFLFSYFLNIFPCMGLQNRSSLIQNLEFPLSKLWVWFQWTMMWLI